MRFLVAAALTLAVFGCRAETAEDPPSIRHLLATPEPVLFEEPTHWIIEAADKDPDAVLVVEVSVPGLIEDASYRFPLKRWEAPGNYRPPFVVHGDAGGVNVLGATADTIKVEADFSGRGQNGKEIAVTQSFSVPWLGAFDGDFSGTGRIRARFERVAPKR